MFTALVILGIVAIRLPSDALGRIGDAIVALFTSGTVVVVVLATLCLILFLVVGVLFGALKLVQKNMGNELERMATHKRTIERRIDARRPDTYTPNDLDDSSPVLEMKNRGEDDEP